ncbi:helicase [Streptomyces sp. 8K308]|nr:helicase [Streptomyces sp. 8K308]
MRRLGWISGVWRSNMRSRRDRLTPEQQAALDELGL